MKSARTSLLAVLAAVSFCSLGFAEGTEGNRDAYIGLPAYLYGRNSMFGLQGGFRLGPGQFRLDLQLSEDYRNGAESWSVLPSAGYFFTQDIQSAVRLRLYGGTIVGGGFRYYLK